MYYFIRKLAIACLLSVLSLSAFAGIHTEKNVLDDASELPLINRVYPTPKATTELKSCLPVVADYGDISPNTGRPMTNSVNGYYRSSGTYVDSYYRS